MNRITKMLLRWLAVPVILGVAATALYFIPPIHQRLAWRIAALQSKVFYALHPPDQIDLGVDPQVADRVNATMTAVAGFAVTLSPSSTISFTPTVLVNSQEAQATPSPAETPTPSPLPTALPARVALQGIRHEYQSFNNCGPANLSMALSYWGFLGDQRTTKAVLRPNDDDANVMPDELASFAIDHAGLRAVIRTGGTLERLKQLLAAGYPVILEMGHQPSGDWWMGHYVVASGYDDERAVLVTQDSLIMPDLPVSYQEIQEHWWRDFNGLYIIIYPPDAEQAVTGILGLDADPRENIQRSLAATQAEIGSLAGRDLFFALYNRASDLLALGEAQEAADAFDLAFAQYQTLEDQERPWRVLWYRVDAYQAYYQAGRYQQVIELANTTLSMLSKRGLEESHYWRGLAYAALGVPEKAREDFEIALMLRPTYREAQEALAK